MSRQRRRYSRKAWAGFLAGFVLGVVGLSANALDAPKASQPQVSDVRVGQHAQQTRIVLDLSQDVKFEVFTLPDPYRVVLNLPEVDWQLGNKTIPENKGVLSRMRYGLFTPGTSRMVLDVKGPVKVQQSFVLKPGTNKHWRLVMDLAPTSETEFLERLAVQRAKARKSLDELVAKVSPPQVPEAKPTPAAVPVPPQSTNPLLPPRRPEAPGKRVIVIDAGHGGVDPGTIGYSKTYEKHITLAMAKQLARTLNATGRYDARLTRTRDIFIRLRDRVRIARKAKADLFISIHADAIQNKRTRGMSVYTLSERASDKEAAKLAAKENKADLIAGIDLSTESKDVTNILLDLAQRETMNQSARFAQSLVGSMRSEVKLLRNTHRFAGFAVLKAPDMPSILIEMGFLSNRQDERNLKSKAYRQTMAEAIVRGIDKHFQGTQEARIH